MIRASLGVRTSGAASGSAAAELIAGTRGFFLREVWIAMAAATASTYALGFPAAKGGTPTTPATFAVEQPIPAVGAVTSTVALAWAVGPTAPTAFFRRISLPATIGAGLPAPWLFGKQGLYVPAGSTLVLWNLAANGVVDASFVIDEQV